MVNYEFALHTSDGNATKKPKVLDNIAGYNSEQTVVKNDDAGQPLYSSQKA